MAYRTGTISIANTQKTVVGVGTSWATDGNVAQDDLLVVTGDSRQAIVDTITDNTHLQLRDNWTGGAVVAGTAYTILQYGADHNPAVALASSIASLIALETANAGHPDLVNNPHDTDLSQVLTAAGLTLAANKLPYLGTAAAPSLADISAFGRTLVASGGEVPFSAADSIASATIAADMPAAVSNYILVTGTTTITALGTVAAGRRRWLRFASALTLVHNATSLVLPGGVNFVTAANDILEFISEGSGNWRMVSGQRASGNNVVALTASDITDAHANGRSLIQSSYATMRTLLGIGAGFLATEDYEAGDVAAGSLIARFTTNGTFSPTGVTKALKYRVIADTVFFTYSFAFNANAYSGAAGVFELAGLPYANAGANTPIQVGLISGAGGWAGSVTAVLNAGASAIRFYQPRVNIAALPLGKTFVPASRAGLVFIVGGSYIKS